MNTGDDFDHFGLTICPDLDTVMYTLSGNDNRDAGWGRAAESWGMMEELGRLGGETWFKLGDKDLALHLLRRQLLDRGATLTAATQQLAARLGVRHAVLPMSDEPVRTIVETTEGELAFQEYFVRRRCEPKVTAFRFEGAAQAAPSPQVEAALCRPGPARDRDLPVQPLCQRRPHPRDRRHTQAARGDGRTDPRGLADRRWTRHQGTRREDDG